MARETQFLARLAANHLYLAQFEPLRAILFALRTRNRDLARSILQTIVAHTGRFQNILWSPSCSSPALLTHLATIELLQFDNASSAWNFDSETLRFRAEFLLLVQNLIDLLSEGTGKNISIEKEKDVLKDTGSVEDQRSELDEGQELRDGNGDLGSRMRILDRILELGMKRLRPEVDVEMDRAETSVSASVPPVEEGELMCLRKVILNHAAIFDALCGNIHKQIRQWECYDPGLATTARDSDDAQVESSEEEDVRILGSILKTVQVVHLDAMKQGMEAGDAEEAVSHIRFLHSDHGVEESEYRIVLRDLVKSILSRSEKFGDSWNAMRDRLLVIYGEALSSDCRDIIQMIQTNHDELLSEEIEVYRAQTDNFVPPPLVRFLRYCAELKLHQGVDDKTFFLNKAVNSCKAEMYHYARVSGLHVLECIMDTTLSAVKREQLEEATDVLQLFPQLQPLVAAMGWDLLAGKIAARRNLMQLLWKSKSQVIRLEESSLYGYKSDEMSCVEQLCDTLCYQLDLASFVAFVNSGRSWNSKFSLTLSGKGKMALGDEDAYSDPFVENFVLERLSVQSPLRVLFDVVPGIKFQEAIELISMEPIASTLAAWKRMQDVELMHMRYALGSTVLALGAMERSISEEKEAHQVALCHLKDLRNHLDSISNLPRKAPHANALPVLDMCKQWLAQYM